MSYYFAAPTICGVRLWIHISATAGRWNDKHSIILVVIVCSGVTLMHLSRLISTELALEFVFRDDVGHFILAKTEWLSPICGVAMGESVNDLQLQILDFELDFKTLVESFPKASQVSELGGIHDKCRYFVNTYLQNFLIKFIRRLINLVVYTLVIVISS